VVLAPPFLKVALKVALKGGSKGGMANLKRRQKQAIRKKN
jgi:hypothetical protein